MAARKKAPPAVNRPDGFTARTIVFDEISAEEVATLPIGSRVDIHGEDENGEHRVIECTVAGLFRDNKKFLTYRVKGELRKCAIKEYPGKTFRRAW